LTIRGNCLGFARTVERSWRDQRRRAIGVPLSDGKEIGMKGLNQKKSDKKKPAKTMKEKRADKQQKKAAKGH
jgi:hypothetical protein